jgi:hypothetical protein
MLVFRDISLSLETYLVLDFPLLTHLVYINSLNMCWTSNHQNTYKNGPRAHFPFNNHYGMGGLSLGSSGVWMTPRSRPRLSTGSQQVRINRTDRRHVRCQVSLLRIQDPTSLRTLPLVYK